MSNKTSNPRKSTKFTLANLTMLEWLCERPKNRLYTTHNVSQSGSVTYLYEFGDLAEGGKRSITRVYPSNNSGEKARKEDLAYERLFGGKVGKNYHKLEQSDLVRSISSLYHGRDEVERFVATLDRERKPFHYSELLHFVTDAGIAYWENEGRAELERLRGNVAEQRASADRLVLIGSRTKITPSLPKHIQDAVRFGLNLPHLERVVIRPYAMARVVKETETRLYVEDVEILKKDLNSSYDGSVYGIIEGQEPNQYVAKERVMMDHITRGLAAKAVEIHEEYVRDIHRIMLENIECIMPFLVESDSRLKQMSAAHEDIMRDLLDPAAAEPSKDVGSSGAAPKTRRR